MRNFTEAIRIDPLKADFYSNRGFAFRKLGRYEEAIADYSKAIELNPSIPFFYAGYFKAFYYRALCHEKLGKAEQEERDYLAALDINPTNVNGLYHLGLCYDRQEKYM